MDNNEKESSLALLDSMLQRYERRTDLFSLSASHHLRSLKLKLKHPMYRYMDFGASSSSAAGAVEESVEQEPKNDSQMEHPVSRQRIDIGASSSSGAGAVEKPVKQEPETDSDVEHPVSRCINFGASSSSGAGAVENSVKQESKKDSDMKHPMSRRINFGASSSSAAGAVEKSVKQEPETDSDMEHPVSRQRIDIGASSSSGAGAVEEPVEQESEKDSDIEIVDDTEVIAAPPDLPPVAASFVKPDLNVGTACIAKDVNKDHTVWRKAVLLIEYINLEFQGDTLRNLSMVKYNNGNTSSKFLKSSEVAYLHPFPSRIPVGTPVVTQLWSSTKYYYPGMVVEGPEFSNKYRYLILLDTGTSYYASHNELGVIRGKHIPKSLKIDKTFIKDCLNFYPDRFLVKFRIGENVHVNRQRSSSTGAVWKYGVVRSVDCSMVEVRFPEGETRWYSRGSYRLMKVISGPIGGLRPPNYIQRLRHVRQEFYCSR